MATPIALCSPAFPLHVLCVWIDESDEAHRETYPVVAISAVHMDSHDPGIENIDYGCVFWDGDTLVELAAHRIDYNCEWGVSYQKDNYFDDFDNLENRLRKRMEDRKKKQQKAAT